MCPLDSNNMDVIKTTGCQNYDAHMHKSMRGLYEVASVFYCIFQMPTIKAVSVMHVLNLKSLLLITHT